jgi:hypothetical protein
MLHADITEPDMVLHAPETERLLDFSKPVGLLAVTIGHHVGPERDPVGVFGRYGDAVVPGSFLAITHASTDFPAAHNTETNDLMKRSQISIFPRSRPEILELFKDFELVEPGLVSTSQWHPDRQEDAATDQAEDAMYAGVGRKS